MANSDGETDAGPTTPTKLASKDNNAPPPITSSSGSAASSPSSAVTTTTTATARTALPPGSKPLTARIPSVADKVKNIEAQEAIKPTSVLPTPVEVDDFGLPLRKPVEIRPHTSKGERTADMEGVMADKEVLAGKVVEKETEEDKGQVRTLEVPTTPRAGAGSRLTVDGERSPSSDDETFEDAVATPRAELSRAASPIAEEKPPSHEKDKSVEASHPDKEVGTESSTDLTAKESKPIEDTKEPIKHGTEIVLPNTGATGKGTAPTSVTDHSKVILTDIADTEVDASQSESQAQVDQHRSSTSKRHSHYRNSTQGTSSTTTTTATTQGLSDFSHQKLTADPVEEKGDDEGEWQTMPAYAPYDIYNDDNKLIAREHDEEEDDKVTYAGIGGAGKGYTRVIIDDDAASATSMDDNTQYLFKDAGGTSIMDDEHQRDAVSQMQATKDLLTEGQRIAYVGLTRLELAAMQKEAESSGATGTTKSTKKQDTLAAESMKMWSQKVMIRLYSHMDISSAEQIMVEQLAEHGVVSSDLTPQLMANAKVHNPLADDDDDDDDHVKSTRTSMASPRPSSSIDHGDGSIPTTPLPEYDASDKKDLTVRTPSQLPTDDKLVIDLRWTVLCDLFLVLIADSVYDSRSRVLLERVAKAMEITWVEICRFEKKVTEALEMQQQAEREKWNEDEHMETRRKMALKRRYMFMGLATVGGGLVIGLSAGLLAPVIGAGLAAGFTTIGVTGTSGFLAGAGGAAIITSGAAASGGVIGVRAANRRTGAVKTFEYRPLHNNKRVNLIVTVSGWMTGKVDDVRLPYSTVDPVMGDLYSVLWEPEMLTSMGDTINILATEALTQGLQQVLGSTILVGLMAALQLPVVLTKLSYLIDNPWAVSLDRAWSAGQILADSLIERNLGERPITLVGYSLGSRVIFSCLLELANRSAFGIVQNVYLFGAPVVVKQDEFLKIRTIIAGRFVNGYNRNDWILGYLFRLTNGGISRVAGLASVEGVPGMQNLDLSNVVNGHMDYRKSMPRLLREAGWLVTDDEFTEIEDPDPENHTQRQRELINEIEEARKEIENPTDGKPKSKGAFGGFFSRRRKAQKAEWEVYEDSHGGSRKEGDDTAAAAATVRAATHGPAKTSDRVEQPNGSNHGVLFDTDAIRAELAKDQLDGDDMEFEVKELPSTLPPMKISAPIHNSTVVSRQSLQQTRSADGSLSSKSTAAPAATAAESQTPFDALPLPSTTTTINGKPTKNFPHDETFATTRPDPSSPTRPELTTSKTVPNMSIADPWADDNTNTTTTNHDKNNYDDDDDDDGEFGGGGGEEEISMTFA